MPDLEQHYDMTEGYEANSASQQEIGAITIDALLRAIDEYLISLFFILK